MRFESIAGVEPFISSMNKLADQNLAERVPVEMGRVVVPFAPRHWRGESRAAEACEAKAQVV